MQHRTGRRQMGFTLYEMLLVIAISVILLAVSLVGISAYMRHLQLTELDNAAKEIFMAAQNRAILLSGGSRLESDVVRADGSNRLEHVDVIPGSGDTTQITAYYIHCDDSSIGNLLPTESIDPALWDGDFYIIYEPESGSVVDVFFSYGTLPVNGNFPAFYEKWRSADKQARMESDPMIGYYGGEAAESGTTISLRTPVINIYNENTLRAEVTYWVPRSLAMMGEAGNVSLTTALEYQGQTFPLALDAGTRVEEPGVAYLAYTYTWTLDSLEDGKRFSQLFTAPGVALTYGDDFTVSAEVSYTGDLKVNGARKTARDNSLFAKDSGDTTAYLTCLRHLQNLHENLSGVSGKEAAVQLGNIEGVEGYLFQPIQNGLLHSYDGQAYAIYDLEITSSDMQPAGLFGGLYGTAAEPIRLADIHLVGTAVSAQSGAAGALVGAGAYLEISGCQVYWENRSEQAINLRDTLGNSADGLRYQITGSGPAGGLAGQLANCVLTGSSASTLIYSGDRAGGLVGSGSGLSLTACYAASYLQGGRIAGLVGGLNGTAQLSACYAVGFLDSTGSGAQAAGLCLGPGRADVSASYSAMLFTPGQTLSNYPLCVNGSYTNTHYLESEHFGFDPVYQPYAISYQQLTDSTRWNSLFGTGVFAKKSTDQSRPYNLQTTLSLTTYIYPGLAGLVHWGDWGAQFQNGSLVYYERYTDGTYGFSGGDVSHLGQDKLVAEDGYAVAYRSTESISGIGATLGLTYLTSAGEQTLTLSYSGAGDIHELRNVPDTTGENSNYYLLPLPGQIVNTDYVSSDFYQKITVADVGEHTEKSYYYNPHFANAILPYEADLDLSEQARQLRVEVRSPRHLYMLSRYAVYYSSANQYRLLQQLDLDYSVYTGYGLFTGSWVQTPIGLSDTTPFRCSYYGSCHTIAGVTAAAAGGDGTAYQFVGLFGYNTGVLQDIVYRMYSPLAVSQSGSGSPVRYAGGLAGYNGGTVDNCAVSGIQLQADCYSYSTVYLGGLVGLNEGVIRSSTAEATHIAANANLSNAYAGGFVGRNSASGSITQCYAVGRVSASRARYGTVYACGFAGQNSASISRSYAAAYLSVEGEAVRFGFCSDATTGCVYLNQGNFTYRDQHYAAQYEDPAATAVTWAQLSGQAASQVVSGLGMFQGTAAPDVSGSYPYPGTVTDGAGAPVHYGQWPDRMDLGVMGVYYWERLDINGAQSYHLSALSLDADGSLRSSTTLSTAHGDGGVVREYGYGYFYQSGLAAPTLNSQDVYWDTGLFQPQAAPTNTAANQALSSLMSGQYVFYSYNTWQSDAQAGLHLMVTSSNQAGTQPPAGTWQLTQSGATLTVRLNPFFAASMAEASEPLPGTAAHPYQVRSIEQLQFINWYGYGSEKTVNRVARPGGGEGYLFLSNWLTGGSGRQYVWVQSHDLDGSHISSYTPIAALYDTAADGKIIAWFSGSYNGNDYTIQEVSISTQDVNTTGLFGVTVNAQLSNIVLYSPSGKAVISSSNSQDAWYAIGGLVGLAANTGGSTRSIENCAVAGYTIRDLNRRCAFGGGGVGGLVGICNMALKNCAAITDIELSFTHSDPTRNVRVGGIAGSCQQSIQACYSGGTITLGSGFSQNTRSNLHIGGITGGYFMKTLSFAAAEMPAIEAGLSQNQVPENLVTDFIDCYSYVEVSRAAAERCASRYAIGGLGEILRKQDGSQLANYENCYYLSIQPDTGAMDWSAAGVSNCTYTDLSSGGSAFDSLLQAGFSTVTTQTADGQSISGRYSFGVDGSLLGRDYPFPTILTQSSDLAPGGLASVHYGNWPLEGIRRADGALPVSLDLFADYDQTAGDAVRSELLTLSNVTEGGDWSVESADPSVAAAELQGTAGDSRTLRIAARKAGSTILTVTYRTGGNRYTLSIEVNVTAQLRLATDAGASVLAFTGSTISTPLELLDMNGAILPQALKQAIVLDGLTAEFDPGYFNQAQIRQEAELLLTAEVGSTAGTTQMTAGYSYTYLGVTYYGTSSLSFRTAAAELALTPVTFTFRQGAVGQQITLYTGANGFTLQADGQPMQVSDIQLVAFNEVSAEFKDILWVEWAADADGTPLPGTLSITAYSQQLYPAAAAVSVQYQFTCAGSTHTLWQDLPVQVTQQTEEGQP